MRSENGSIDAAATSGRRGRAGGAGARVVVLAALLIPVALAAQARDPAATEPRLRPGDMVRLQVGGEPQLSGDFPVTEEGVALLPLLGLVDVADRPFADVRSEVRAGLHRELVDPAVLVVPVLRIAVLGEVRQPGLIPVDPTMSPADVIASAGGLTPSADAGKVMLIRDGVAAPLAFDAPSAARDRPLLSGDQLVVGRQSWLRENLGVVLTTGGSVLAAIVTSLILANP